MFLYRVAPGDWQHFSLQSRRPFISCRYVSAVNVSGSISSLTCCYLTARWRGLLGIWLSELGLSALSRLGGRIWKCSSVKGVIPGSASFSSQTHQEGPGISFPPVEIRTKKIRELDTVGVHSLPGKFQPLFYSQPIHSW